MRLHGISYYDNRPRCTLAKIPRSIIIFEAGFAAKKITNKAGKADNGIK